jgi:hypothetical protein
MNENAGAKTQAPTVGASVKRLEGSGGREQKRRGLSWQPFVIGAIAFFLVTGGRIARPGNIGWVMDGDAGMNFLGWTFFRDAPLLQQPFGANWRYGTEMSSSLVYSDSLPLLGFLLKPITSALPEHFQYFGVWILLCFLLQAFFAWKLLERLEDGIWSRVFGVLFFVLAPPFLYRIFGQYSLGAHWLILASLYLYLSERFHAGPWILLLVVASLITPILLGMALLVFGAALTKHYFARDLTLVKGIRAVALTFVVLLFVMWEAGYFTISTVGASGFGFYRTSLLGFVDPKAGGFHWSQLLKDQPQAPGNYEGFCFLGTGMILLSVVAGAEVLRRGVRWIPWRELWPLLFVFVFSILFALSNNVGIGPYIIFHYDLPMFVERLISPFRGSGRFIWLAYYMLMAGVLAVLFKSLERRACPALIGFCLLLQVADSSSPLAIYRNSYLAKFRPNVLPSPFWATAAQRYNKIIYVLPRDGVENYIPLCFLAAQHHIPVNICHTARIDSYKLAAARTKVLANMENGPLDLGALYVFDTAALWELGLRQVNKGDWAGVVDGFKVIAPSWDQKSNQNPISTLRTVMREYRMGAHILFAGGADRELLGYGWSLPGTDGVWSDGDKASVVLLLEQEPDSDAVLMLDGGGFVSSKCPRQEIEIRVNSLSVGRISYSTQDPGGTRSVRIPREALVGDNGLVTIEFRFQNDAASERLGPSLDPSNIALLLKGLTLKPAEN